MKHYICAKALVPLAAALLIVSFPAISSENRFLSAISDVPLMEGLNEINSETTSFDTPSGRIVETVASGKVSEKSIFSFYSRTLPQLGWQESGGGVYIRESEELLITIESKSTYSYVRYALSPR